MMPSFRSERHKKKVDIRPSQMRSAWTSRKESPESCSKSMLPGIRMHGCFKFLRSYKAFKELCEEGRLSEMLDAVAAMQPKEVSADTFYCLLQDCIRNKDLTMGRAVRQFIIWSGLESSTFLASHLIRLFSVCRSLSEANRVFRKLPETNVFAWTAMISAYTNLGHGQKAIQLHYHMQKVHVTPDGHSFVAILKACADMAALSQGRLIHAHIIEIGLESNVFVGNTLVDMYAKGGSMGDSLRLFDGFLNKDVTTWNAMITGFFQSGYTPNALKLFEQMQQEEGLEPNTVTWNAMIAGCVQHGLCEEAFQLFLRMQQEGLQADKLTWNSLISGYAQHDCGHISLQLFRQMQMEGTEPDMVTFMSVLKACSIAVLDQARFMHSQMVETGLHSAVWIGSNLIDMYAKCGDLQAAVGVFDRLTQKDLVSWNAIIAAHVNHACSQEVFQLFQRMQDEGMPPHQVTFVLMLKACSSRGALYEGKLLYSYIIESHCELDVFVGTALIDLYMKCGSLEDACVVFNKLPKRGVVTWSALVAGYAWHGYTGESSWLLQQMQQEGIKPTVVTWNGVIRGCAYNGLCSEALRNFQQMLLEGFEPNEASLVGVLSACSGFGDLIQGEVMHAYIIEGGWENNLNAGSALISMYANLGCLRASNWIFDGLSKQEVLVWSAMIEAFAQHGHYQEAMQLFQGMQQEGEVPNQVILTCILKACVNTTMLYQSKMAHVLALELGFESNMLVGHSLINVYTKCGNLEDAWSVFYKLQDRDEVTWSAMIEGFAEHGDYKSALHCFQGMQGEDLNPNSVTFLSLLSACSHAGLVQEACHYFNLMQNTYCVAPTFTHYNCMADLLGRAGRLVEANDLLQTMPYRPTFVGHLCLLNHCKTYGNFSIGKKYFNLTYHVTSRHSASYDFMAEIYAHAGNWKASDSLKKLKKCANAWKKPGGAHVEFDNNVQFFTVGERRHPQTREILATLKKLGGQLEEEGYVPHLDLMSDKEGAYCTEAF